MKLTSALSITFALGASLAACSSDPSTGGGGAGTAGSSAGASSVAGSGGQPSNTAGAGQAGASAGAPSTSAGAGGAAGASAGAGGAAGSASAGSSGSAGASGASFWGPTGPKKQWSCPPPPYATQNKGPAVDVCVGFKYNYTYNEGPTWIASQKAFFFSNFLQGKNTGGDIIKYTLGGACEVWLHDVGCNGLGVSPSGNLLAACHGSRSVMEYDLTSKVGRKVASMVGDKMLDSPNDLIARSDGNVYFSNTTYELGNGVPGLKEALVRIDPFGVTSVIEAGGLNGVALSPDETKLYVVGKGTFTLDAAGVATKMNGGPTPGGDGIAVDCAGNISNTGTNSAFGGLDGMTLIAVGGGTAAKTYAMTVPGLP
jgi:gluconolactonase